MPGGNLVEQVSDGKPPRPGATPATGNSPIPIDVHARPRDRRSQGDRPGTSGLGNRPDRTREFDSVPIDIDDDDTDNDDEEEEDDANEDPSGPTPDHMKPLDLSSIQLRVSFRPLL